MAEEPFRALVDGMKEGVIVMDRDRAIHYMNPAAEALTGWRVGERAPYCAYCTARSVLPGEERCLLAQNQSLPYFESEMAVYRGKHRSFQMSLAPMSDPREEGRLVLLIRTVLPKEEDHKWRLSQLLLRETIAAQEAERRRIARELHDNVSQKLFSAYLATHGIRMRLTDPELAEYCRNVAETLQEVMEDVKAVSRSLHPATLDLLGIVPTVRAFCRQWSSHTLRCDFDTNIPDDRRYAPDLELNVYRIIQEATVNAVKHADCTELDVKLMEDDHRLLVQVTDNGKGLRLPAKEGLGIRHMRERAQVLGGVFCLTSELGRGTTVQCTVPLRGDGW
ncbi:MAG TPA: PAS domain-containing protein [Alicyclobacillus sp.]|nr:PAS domain-containing protein [Alicyclobacillus sp.]